MRIFSENSVIENLLVCYFTQESNNLIAEDVKSGISMFLDFYKMSDEIHGENNVEIIKKIYSTKPYENRNEFLKSLNMSETALFRFRNKIVEELSKHIQNLKKSS